MTINSITIGRRVVIPFRKAIGKSSSGAIVLLIATIAALLMANSHWADSYHKLWQINMGFSLGDFHVYKPFILWINDGLMSIFFFVVGLELKREIVSGELSNPKNAVIPFIAGIGGMVMPAVIYLAINAGTDGEALNGWGIPMATDIAFALGILYLLGNRVPLSLKVFLTALAIIDDLGAVSVIAFFYTSDISIGNLGIGAAFLASMLAANLMGVRNPLFYGALGIGGLWLAFLLSGVHATIAAVLAAFTIPARYDITKYKYLRKADLILNKFCRVPVNDDKLLDEQQYNLLQSLKKNTDKAIPPLQMLEHKLHGFVSFVVLPIFAFSNAGISFTGGFIENINDTISLGIILGLLLGKVTGIVGFLYLSEKLKLIQLPRNISYKLLFGVSCLAAVGFTMSLFITSLAFENPQYDYQARIGILFASLLAGLIGYLILYRFLPKEKK
ncbi:MAG TPA: Na+/H+ antiporter NhaA [Cyclobacteriaceae bacterium]|nr:Na+/H+ antiporter NhaA [Cyclobacteriaceae bacterium]